MHCLVYWVKMILLNSKEKFMTLSIYELKNLENLKVFSKSQRGNPKAFYRIIIIYYKN